MPKVKTQFSPSPTLRKQAEADYLATEPLIQNVIRLTNLMANARRDVTMWTSRLAIVEAMKKRNPTDDIHDRSIEVAQRNLVSSNAKLEELLKAGDQSVTLQTEHAAKALQAQFNLISAGPCNWVAIDASREKKITKYNRQIDELSAECRQHHKTGRSLRRDAVKQLELHKAQSAVSLIMKSQKELLDAAWYPNVITHIQDRRERATQQYEVAMLAEWLRTMPEKLQAMLHPPQLEKGETRVS